MSCMFSTNDCVPAGTLLHEIAGDNPSPVATPGAAWLFFTGIGPPSAKPATVIVIAPGGACAEEIEETTINTEITEITETIKLSLLAFFIDLCARVSDAGGVGSFCNYCQRLSIGRQRPGRRFLPDIGAIERALDRTRIDALQRDVRFAPVRNRVLPAVELRGVV